MKKVLLVILLMGFFIGRDALRGNPQHEKVKSFNSKQELVQVGHINEFVLDQGHPFKKPSAFGYAVIQQGKLEEFILDHGYPSKIRTSQTLSKFKIIREY